jgi:hypothetical protein
MTRASELVGLRWDRLQTASDLSGLYRFGKTKTDQAGHGVECCLRPATMAELAAWQAASPVGAYVFHPVADDFYLDPMLTADDAERARWTQRHQRAQAKETGKLAVREVGTVLRRATALAGISLDDRWLSGHSGRVGAAQDMVLAGSTTAEVQIAGRWTSERMPISLCRSCTCVGRRP